MFYIYEFPIYLENVYKLIGFSNKGNAKSTLVNNFIENVDYKISLLRTQKRSHTKGGENLASAYAEASWGGANKDKSFAAPYGEAKNNEENRGGSNKEIIMLNVDTFKNLCMLTKTEKAKQIRTYYIKLENMFNKLLKQEMEENKKQLKEKEEHWKIILLKMKITKSPCSLRSMVNLHLKKLLLPTE
jgi:hypothetical protein